MPPCASAGALRSGLPMNVRQRIAECAAFVRKSFQLAAVDQLVAQFLVTQMAAVAELEAGLTSQRPKAALAGRAAGHR